MRIFLDSGLLGSRVDYCGIAIVHHAIYRLKLGPILGGDGGILCGLFGCAILFYWYGDIESRAHCPPVDWSMPGTRGGAAGCYDEQCCP